MTIAPTNVLVSARFASDSTAESEPGAGFDTGRNSEISNNREKNRRLFRICLKIIELCPKSANFVERQGVNREFCGNLPERLRTKRLSHFSARFRKLTGSEQEIRVTF